MVLVPGGLGNQLFSYFFALYLKSKVKANVILNFTNVDKSHHKSSISILAFDLSQSGLQIAKISNSKIGNLPLWNISKVYNRIIGKFQEKSHHVFEPGKDKQDNIHDFLDTWKLSKKYKIKLDGYFGDFVYFDNLNEENRKMEILNPSRVFLEYSEQFRSTNLLAIHHRLGDYLELQNSIGLLGRHYYSEALASSRHLEFDKVVIFSNQTEISKEIFLSWKILDRKVEWFGPEDLSNPSETLILMSKANALICSNSTFSFWAAKLADLSNSKVFYPDKWRMDGFEGVGSIPREWIPIKSDWNQFQFRSDKCL